jgi:hypothetical protein
MNNDLLNNIKSDILKLNIPSRLKSNDFCGIIVEGRNNAPFEDIDAAIHSFRAFSEYNYPVFLFVSRFIDFEVINKLNNKYDNIFIHYINPLKNSFEYNQWMFNNCFRFIPSKFEKCLTIQNDGFLIKSGWEQFVSDKKFSFLGACWRSENEALSNFAKLKAIKIGNGGFSYRFIPDLLKCLDIIDEYGGQHNFFRGQLIDGKLMQNNSWLAEDLMFCSIGFSYDIFNPVTIEDCNKFSLEPITFDLYKDINNPKRPFGFHKIDE